MSRRREPEAARKRPIAGLPCDVTPPRVLELCANLALLPCFLAAMNHSHFPARAPPPARRRAARAAALLATGCIGLEQKERELTFRPTPADAAGTSGCRQACIELDLPVDATTGRAADPRMVVARRRPGGARRLLPARRALESHRPPEPDRAAPAIRVLGVRDRLSRLRQERRRPAVGGDRLRGRARRLALGRRARARSGAPLHLRSLARRRGGGRSRREPRRGADGARGLVIESSFTNFAEMASEITRGMFPAAMLSQKFDSVGKIARVRMPVLIVHGEGDRYRAGALQRSAVRGRAHAEETADRAERQPQQQPVDRQFRVPPRAGRFLRPRCAARVRRGDAPARTGGCGRGGWAVNESVLRALSSYRMPCWERSARGVATTPIERPARAASNR